MEQSDQLSSTSSLPRLRVTRNTLTDPTVRRITFESNPVGSEHSNPNFAAMSQDYQSTSEDDFALEEVHGTNARLLSVSLPPVDDSLHTSETSNRLKSILERFDNSVRAAEATSRVSMPPTPSEPDFDFDLEPAQTARYSIRSLIENALREPGDTPQKSKLMRRASFNASDSPKVDKTIRRSLSDEEREAQSRITSQIGTSALVSDSPQPDNHDASPQVIPLDKVARHSPINLFHPGLITRPRSHKDLEPFRPVSSESGLSSPERSSGGRTLKSSEVLSNSNRHNFVPHLNSDAKQSSRSQFLDVSHDQPTPDNHLRPVSPNLSIWSSRTSSPNHGRTEISASVRSSPTSARSGRFFHKESHSNHKDVPMSTWASERDGNSKDWDSERDLEHEREQNWNRHHPERTLTRSVGSISTHHTHNSHDRERDHGKPLISNLPRNGSSLKPVPPTIPDEHVEKLHERERKRNSPKPHSRHTLYGTGSPSSHSHETSGSSSQTFLTPQGSLDKGSPQIMALSSMLTKEDSAEVLPSQRQTETPPSSLSKATAFSTGSLGRSSRPKLNPSQFDPPKSSDFHMQFRKGHRRMVTELPEFTKQSSPAQSSTSDGSTESFEPPHMSTPTSKSSKLPDANASSPDSPPLPNNSFSKVTMQTDLARLHKAIQPNFTFPSRSSTQARDLSPTSEASHDLQDEPFPPMVSVDDARTPLVPEQYIESYIKTPRPPGAFGTPYFQPGIIEPEKFAPSADTSPSRVNSDYGQNNAQDSYINKDMDTVATPAPPGAYRMTPGMTKRKGILKVVRFDDAEDDAADRNALAESKNQVTETLTANLENENLEKSPTRRKGIRLVDEYGRVRKFTEDGTEVPLDRKRNVSQPDITMQQTVSLSGIEPITVSEQQDVKSITKETATYTVTQPESTDTEFLSEPEDKKAVVAHLTKSLGEMQVALAREEKALAVSLPKDRTVDNGRLNSLTTVSQTARLEREKLARRLELEKDAEGKIQKRVFTARSTSTHTPRGSWWLRRWRLLLLGFILEFCFLYLGYRIALIHSKQIWLGIHFDPFYPALYIHNLQPKFLNHARMLPVNWSVFSVPGITGNNEMGYTIKSFGKRLWDTVWNWKLGPWDNWGALTETSIPQAWPS